MSPYYSDGDVTLHHGHALDVARTLKTGSVRTIVTSPPYFGLRDYGHDDQLGAEATVDAYVTNLVTLFRELRRVLTDDGTLWLNLGDSYSGPKGDNRTAEDKSARSTLGPKRAGLGAENAATRSNLYTPRNVTDVAPKNLLGVPWRVAFALQTDGWILRSDIIWAKPNPMPESVTDRPTKAHEYLFLLAKNPRYYYDADAIAEPVLPDTVSHARNARGYDVTNAAQAVVQHRRGVGANKDIAARRMRPEGIRNKRSVWEVPTAPFPGAHFAVYPPALIRPCIRAGSAPGDVVLDPFSGSGTTGAVATYEGRRYLGIDVNAEYLDLSIRTRFAQPTLGIEAVS